MSKRAKEQKSKKLKSKEQKAKEQRAKGQRVKERIHNPANFNAKQDSYYVKKSNEYVGIKNATRLNNWHWKHT